MDARIILASALCGYLSGELRWGQLARRAITNRCYTLTCEPDVWKYYCGSQFIPKPHVDGQFRNSTCHYENLGDWTIFSK
jgi:hypothetical protein